MRDLGLDGEISHLNEVCLREWHLASTGMSGTRTDCQVPERREMSHSATFEAVTALVIKKIRLLGYDAV